MNPIQSVHLTGKPHSMTVLNPLNQSIDPAKVHINPAMNKRILLGTPGL